MPTITTSTPLTGTSTGTINEAMRYAALMGADRPEFLADYLAALYELAPQVGLRADLAVAQSVHETNAWRSSWWVDRGNPAGIGITGDKQQDAASGTWATGRDAAKAQLAHLLGYVRGSAPPVAEPWIALDPRWSALMKSGMAGTAQSIGDFGDGVWAVDPAYADKWVSRFADVFNRFSLPVEHPPAGGATVPDLTMTKGLIPLPFFNDWLIPDADNVAWDDLGQRTVKGFVLHRQLGSNMGTNSYFRTLATGGSAGLTDYGQNAIDGSIIRWNDPLGAAHDVAYSFQSGGKNIPAKGKVSPNRAGWASGTYNGAYGDGLKFAQKYGINAINRDQVSWEIDGFYGDPWSAKAMQIAAQVCAHYAHDYGIPWDVFPIAPQDGFSFIRWHQEFTLGTGKVCPGDVVMAQTDTFIGLVKAILKQYQTAGVPETPEPPKPIPVSPYPKGMTPELARELYGSVGVSWASEPFTFDLDRSECRAWLEFGKGTIPAGKDYRDGNWGTITGVIRRGNKGSAGRVYRYSNGFVYFQAPAKDQKGKAA